MSNISTLVGLKNNLDYSIYTINLVIEELNKLCKFKMYNKIK